MKMNLRITSVALFTSLFVACGSETDTTTSATSETTTDSSDVIINDAPPASPDSAYAADWETFKQAVLNKDIQGISAFASSDAIDAEALLTSMSEDYILETLKNTTYDDLTKTDQEGVTVVEFSAMKEGTDDEGAAVGNGITLYFSQDSGRLLLDAYIAAG